MDSALLGCRRRHRLGPLDRHLRLERGRALRLEPGNDVLHQIELQQVPARFGRWLDVDRQDGRGPRRQRGGQVRAVAPVVGHQARVGSGAPPAIGHPNGARSAPGGMTRQTVRPSGTAGVLHAHPDRHPPARLHRLGKTRPVPLHMEGGVRQGHGRGVRIPAPATARGENGDDGAYASSGSQGGILAELHPMRRPLPVGIRVLDSEMGRFLVR